KIMTSQALIPVNNPAELILAEIEAKHERFKQERGEYLTAFQKLKQQLNHIENQIKQKDQKEGQ
ncbi:19509_t:CDS:1, partial [Racocetra fulgida]